jgi:hypothetical protein
MGLDGNHGNHVNRRGMDGQVYSLIAILIAIPLILFVTFYLSGEQHMDYAAIDKVVADQMHEVERSIEKDFVQAMSISGKRAFLAASNDVIREGRKLDDANARLLELLTNGSLYGNYTYVMENNTINDWMDKITDMDLGFGIGLNYSNLTLQGYDAFNILLSVNLKINVTDELNASRIDRSLPKESLISIEQVEDPIFALNTFGFISRPIKEYPYPYHAIEIVSGTSDGTCRGNVTFDPMDPDASEKILVTEDAFGASGFLGIVAETSFIPSASCYVVNAFDAVNKTKAITEWSGYPALFIDNETSAVWSLPVYEIPYEGYYTSFESDTGPDIFERLEGSLTSSSENGMETFINVERFQLVGLPVKTEQVSVEYLYFSYQSINGVPARGMPPWFRIDFTRAAKYNLTDLMETG